MDFYDTISQYTNRAFLVKYQDDSATRMNGFKNRFPNSSIILNSSYTFGQPAVTSSKRVKLDPNNRIDIECLIHNSDSVLHGYYFLCRNISPPFKMSSLLTVVDDPKGEKAVRLALYNFTEASAEDLLKVLPIGQILAIKNPWFKSTMDGGYTVRVDNPSDVVFVDDTVFPEMFPGLDWQGEILEKYKPFLKSLTQSDPKTPIEWKNLGNKLFLAKEFVNALQAYSSGLNMEPHDVDLLANRAAAYIALGYYYRALEDSESVLQIEQHHTKGIYRKAKSLIGLKRYDSAIDFLDGNASLMNETKEILNVIKIAKKLKSQQEDGSYNWLELYGNSGEMIHEDLAEYTGPVTVSNIPGKGRGVIATENISPGQILMTSKALSIVGEDDPLWKEISIDHLNGLVHWPGQAAIVKKVMDKLAAEPEHNEEFYKLYAGPNMKMSGEDAMKKIDAICSLNGFSGKIKAEHAEMSMNPASQNSDHNVTGVWNLPSYINHSCWDCNAFWEILGDFMIVRSFKKIPKGDEILIPYISPAETYSKREQIAQKHGFVCNCKLCEIQRSESKVVKLQKKKLLRQVKNCSNLSLAPPLIMKLEKLWAEHPELNVTLAYPLDQIGREYFKNQEFRECIDLLVKAHALLENSPLIQIAAKYAINIVGALIVGGYSREEVGKWVNILKKDLMIGYGTLEIIKIIGPDTLILIQKFGVDFMKMNY